MAEKNGGKRSNGGKIGIVAAILALLAGGGYVGFGNGGEVISNVANNVADQAVNVVETVQDVVAPDDGSMTIVVREDKLYYNNRAVTLDELEERLLRDWSEEKEVELVDRQAIKSAYDDAVALLDKLDIPYRASESPESL